MLPLSPCCHQYTVREDPRCREIQSLAEVSINAQTAADEDSARDVTSPTARVVGLPLSLAKHDVWLFCVCVYLCGYFKKCVFD